MLPSKVVRQQKLARSDKLALLASIDGHAISPHTSGGLMHPVSTKMSMLANGGRVACKCLSSIRKDLCSGEWLCWPCKVYEEKQRAEGVAQSKIRPPRWEVQGGQLQEGSKACQCALCPVRQGAFRRTADGKAWIHEVLSQSLAMEPIACMLCAMPDFILAP